MSYDDENSTFPRTQDIDALSKEEGSPRELSDEYFKETCPDPNHFNDFHLHAAPVAIEYELRWSLRQLEAARKRVEWLRDLRAKRASQVMRGEWPKPKT